MPRSFVYLGCGTAIGDILIFAFNAATGDLTPAGRAEAGGATSGCAVHPTGKFLYVTRNRTHHVAAFRIDQGSAALTLLNLVATAGVDPSKGAGPTYLDVDRTGQVLLAANYAGHTINLFPILVDGTLGDATLVHSAGQHAHAIRFDPANRFAFAPNLGSDLVARYAFDSATGVLAPQDPPAARTTAGEGPRHFEFHCNGRWIYLVTELGGSVITYDYDATGGSWTAQQRLSALPGDYTGRKWSSDIHVAPSGRFVYVSNRAHDSLAVFAVDPASGKLGLVEHVSAGGKTPRLFTLSPDGRFLLVANQDSNNLVTFSVDPDTGKLTLLRSLTTPENPYFVRVLHLPDA